MGAAVTKNRPHVVIVGGGFGGLEAAKRLRRSPVRVTLVDRRNFHLFQPLLYQVATGGLSSANIATPLRYILRKQQNCEVVLAEVTDFDVAGKRLITEGAVPADQPLLVRKPETEESNHAETAREASHDSSAQ